MERIIQLKEQEYHALVTKATANEDEIKEMAKEMYQEYALSSMDITLRVIDNSSGISFDRDVRMYNSRNEEGFSIIDAEREAIVEFVEDSIKFGMTKLYGVQIKNMNHYKELSKDVENRFNNFLIITIVGWLMAIAMFLAVILK